MRTRGRRRSGRRARRRLRARRAAATRKRTRRRDRIRPPSTSACRVRRLKTSSTRASGSTSIFSYLQPRTLYRLAFLNRSFHTMLSSPGFRSTWRDIFTWHDPRMDWMDDVFFGFDEEEQPEQKKAKPKPRDKMPVFGGKEIDPYRLAILLYETTCEFCGEDTVKYPDTFFLLRLCAYCRRNNLVSSTALAESKKYDMHPATMRAVLASPFGIDELKKYSYERNVLVTHFYQTIDELEERQAEDDADQQTANAQLGTHATGRNPSRAAKVKASSRARAQLDDDDAAEDERNGPRVAAFLKARAKERDARHTFVNAVDELAVKIDRFCEDEVVESRLFSMQAKSMRLEGIRQRLADEAIFEPRHINDMYGPH
ncbi:hypothetical protein AAT19DRAFT_12865 [Rhodotorula toruloides]|uniref:F-box domain-containing protein n=1 Tax=Rhodotorula toruloides TaxID=5286 RepID=A0A2T0ACW3_RHOTO|nr:hypothetical protein AAT19DRAFT_12865 [Rhodotorula toruloides]